VLEAFSRLKRIDMLIHVSAQDLQRNLDSYTKPDDDRLERFMPGWRKVVDPRQSQQATRAALLAYWASKIEALGLPPAKHAELVSGISRNQRLYWLVFVSRSDFAKSLWTKSEMYPDRANCFDSNQLEVDLGDKHGHRMDRGDVESDCRMQDCFPRLH
jgi:three-Cys-motif partner protein